MEQDSQENDDLFMTQDNFTLFSENDEIIMTDLCVLNKLGSY